MAKKSGRISLKPEDAIDVGLWQGGKCVVKDAQYCEYDYGGNSKPVPVLLLTFQHAEGEYEQPYSIGTGWEIVNAKDKVVTVDGARLSPTKGQTGLPKSSNAFQFFKSFVDAGGEMTDELDDDVHELVGMGFVMRRENQPDRSDLDDRKRGGRRGKDDDDDDRDEKKRGKGRDNKQPRTYLLVEEVLDEAPEFDEPKKGKASSKSKKQDDEDDDEDEAPKSKTSKSRKAADDDDDDEPKGKSKTSKSRKADDDDEDDDEDDDAPKGRSKSKSKGGDDEVMTEATDLLMEVLEKNDGELDADDVEEKVRLKSKGHPLQKKILALFDEDTLAETLAEMSGITYNKKKGLVTLDS